MPTVYVSPFGPKPQFELSDGTPAVGGQLFFYVSGTSTKQSTYTDDTGNSANTNPIALNALGMPANEIWFAEGLTYTVVYAPVGDTDPPASPIWTVDGLTGQNDPTAITGIGDQWIASGLTATFVSGTSFTLVGDQTGVFSVGRRVRTVNSGNTVVYGRILTSVFGAVTTVTVVNDSGAIDSGLSAVSYGIVTEVNTSMPWFSGALGITGVISPTALSGSENNWNPTGLSTASIIRASASGGVAYGISGLAGGVNGRVMVLSNIGTSGYLSLPNESGSSIAANQFLTPNAVNFSINPQCAAILRYDGTSSRWRFVGAVHGIAGTGGTEGYYPGLVQLATQAEVEAAAVLTRVAPVSRLRYAPSAAKFWAQVTVSGGTPTLGVSSNVTSITDTGPGLLTVNFTEAFSSANWSCDVAVERASTALTVANLRNAAVRNAGMAAGSVLVECWDDTATTANQVDPATWYVSGYGDN